MAVEDDTGGFAEAGGNVDEAGLAGDAGMGIGFDRLTTGGVVRIIQGKGKEVRFAVWYCFQLQVVIP